MSSRSVRFGALAALAASLFCALGIAARAPAARADDPPLPQFAFRYGRVMVPGNQELQPALGRVIAIVRGRGCGEGATLTAPAGSGEDTGHSVYSVQIEANTVIAGCGLANEPITLWFPDAGRMAENAGPWSPGTSRLDAFAARELPFRVTLASLARE